MKTLAQFLDEGLSSVLYHYTSVRNAAQIVGSDQFTLTAVTTTSDTLAKGKKATAFYLSTTRSKVGAYTKGNIRGVVMELDGRKLGQNYAGSPVDYWGREFRKVNPTGNEMEDRVYSKKRVIPNATKYIKGLHVLIEVRRQGLTNFEKHFGQKPDDQVNRPPLGTVLQFSDEHSKKYIRQLWKVAIQKGVPIYFYDEPKYWLAMKKPMSLKVGKLKPDEIMKPSRSFGKSDRWVKPWIELLLKPTSQKLSKQAQSKLDYFYGFNPRPLTHFMNDMGSAKNSPKAEKVLQIMHKLKLGSYEELMRYIEGKWLGE